MNTDTAKKHRTNSLHVREQIRAHILDCVHDHQEEPFDSIQGACQHVMACFDSWDCEYERKRTPNHQERFSDWLWGLPFNFEYTHCGIADFLNGLGINPEGREYGSEKASKLYHHLIWSEVQKAVS